jgi:hypothetical protein
VPQTPADRYVLRHATLRADAGACDRLGQDTSRLEGGDTVKGKREVYAGNVLSPTQG